MTDDLTLLASAYLDGQATAAERAQVDADAELLAEVERLRRVRSVLGSPDDASAAPISTRERHIAAALDAWDRLPASELGSDATPASSDQAGAAGGASITAPTPLRQQRAAKRGPVSTRLLTAAAAVVVLAGAGVVIRGALESADTDQSADTASFEVDSADENRSLEVLAAEEFVTEGEGEAADEVAAEAAPPPAVAAEAVVSGGPDQAPAESEYEVLSSKAELADFANLLIISRTNQANSTTASEAEESSADAAADQEVQNDADQATAATTPPTLPAPVDLCRLIDDFVGFAFWNTPGLFDDLIAVGIDNATNEAVAYRSNTCTEVARTPLP